MLDEQSEALNFGSRFLDLCLFSLYSHMAFGKLVIFFETQREPKTGTISNPDDKRMRI
jgi:hypothetical protein